MRVSSALETPARTTPRGRTRLARALTLAALTASVAAAATRALSRRLIFPAHRVPEVRVPSDLALRTARARDGVIVRSFELSPPPGAPVVVHFHGNRSNALDLAEIARALHARGVGVSMLEYRGYGVSRGEEPTEQGLYLDAEAALTDLARRGVGPERVVLWGTSLGTGVAAEMARRGRAAALVLVTPYTSIPDLASDAVPLLPARLLVRDVFDTLAKTSEIRVPTLVIHGDEDEVVPYWMGERVAHAILGARLLRVPAGRHGDLFARERDRLIDAILALSLARAG